jgi:hypothetical protein
MAEWTPPSKFRSGLMIGVAGKPGNTPFDPMLVVEV